VIETFLEVFMAKITYIEFSGQKHVLDVETGKSLMQAAVDNSLQGILGDCGGACSCATCHCYVEESWLDKLPAKSDTEEMLLEEVVDPKPNSRLSCQIKASDELEGLVVYLPAKQV
jgi:2Fe-2S ferredoxin